jgi:hypothetical protein
MTTGWHCVRPSQRADYWQHLFPWEAAWQLATATGTAEPRVAHRFPVADGGGAAAVGETGMSRHGTYTTADAWKRTLASRGTTSIHLEPDQTTFLVVDYDIRGDRRPPPECATSGQHGPRDLCRRCWETHVGPAMAHLDRQLRVPLGIPRAAVLPVFSGGNGVHVWYNLLSAPAATREALAKPAVRRLLMEDWLAVSPAAPVPAFDVRVTTDPGHLVRCPFSLHDRTGLPALPLGRDSDGRLELPPHVARPAASDADVAEDVRHRIATLFRPWLAGSAPKIGD